MNNRTGLKSKIQNLEYKINQIVYLGGVVQKTMYDELEKLKKDYSLIEGASSKIEASFEKEYKKHFNILKEKLEKAENSMHEVLNYADTHGIQFTSNFKQFKDTYSPDSILEKWGDIDFDFKNKVLKECGEYFANGGG